MLDVDAALIALAEGRVRTTKEIVSRQRTLMAGLTASRHSIGMQASLLRLFEDNLAIFERHLTFLERLQAAQASRTASAGAYRSR